MDETFGILTEPLNVEELDRTRYHQENDDPPEFSYYDMEDNYQPCNEAE